MYCKNPCALKGPTNIVFGKSLIMVIDCGDVTVPSALLGLSEINFLLAKKITFIIKACNCLDGNFYHHKSRCLMLVANPWLLLLGLW